MDIQERALRWPPLDLLASVKVRRLLLGARLLRLNADLGRWNAANLPQIVPRGPPDFSHIEPETAVKVGSLLLL